MIVYPSIDLQGGRGVRLYQGHFDQATVHAEDPVAQARLFAEAGAAWLHLVDLDAARGVGDNRELIAEIVRSIQIPVQLGGGLRDADRLRRAFDAGIRRAVIGTAAVESPDFARAAVAEWGDRVAVSVETRGGRIAVRGWAETTSLTAPELAARLAEWGVARILYTDVDRDGTLTEPNFGVLAELVHAHAMGVIASGGVASVEHLVRLRDLGVEGAIVGKALYTGAVDLRAALLAVARED